jgi:hypothetical protein
VPFFSSILFYRLFGRFLCMKSSKTPLTYFLKSDLKISKQSQKKVGR